MTGRSEKQHPKEQHYADAWSRFERAVDVVAKSPPQHRITKKPKKQATKRCVSSSKP